ncbi:hypothetical protein SPRG_01515 [Saprolegnia parasitica CBS 223.65]|uniref:3-dehydroquinate dehydratase n=1 Tax=Saprolegnia parasitica (strain CBS 223.65) TaxID=695850 RepID=A0A067CUJ4_SAPPC|nr:hypothetical protein SPRG_01515 [Saprolegnia parasitica CBS 223.65]KDO34379.1 hypothetical protein SPRG_01515 [Saprolegnia parasitica CBS 223.65]|eukprot:XP_012195115.1 hypothetical protein SPRG_01515 [Saprolegnia parasitica CBS 223.65]
MRQVVRAATRHLGPWRRAYATTKKSADDYFLPNLFGSVHSTTALPPNAPARREGEEDLYDSDMDLLDAELSSLLGPLPDKEDDAAYDPTSPLRVERPRPPAPPYAAPQPTQYTAAPPTPMQAAPPTLARSPLTVVGDVHILNGPCSLVHGNVLAGTQVSWPRLEAQLRTSAQGVALTSSHTNDEGAVIDTLLSSAASTTIILNAGGLLGAGIRRAVELSHARVILINPLGAPAASPIPAGLRYISGFGAVAYELALLAATKHDA